MQTLANRLTWTRDRSSGDVTVVLDGRELVSGPEVAVRLALFRRGGLADIVTEPKGD